MTLVVVSTQYPHVYKLGGSFYYEITKDDRIGFGRKVIARQAGYATAEEARDARAAAMEES